MLHRRIIKSCPTSAFSYEISRAADRSARSDSSTIDAFPQQVQAVFRRCNEIARSVVENARTEAESIREAAIRNSQEAFSKAKQDGERAGIALATKALLEATATQRARAIAAVRTEAEEEQRRYTKLLEKIVEQRATFFATAEQELVRLALGIAEEILDTHVRSEPTYIIRLAKRALARIGSVDEICVRCSVEDQVVLAEHREQLMFEHSTWRFIADPTLARGSLEIIAGDNSVDIGIGSQLSRVRQVLMSASQQQYPTDLRLAS